MTHCRVQNILPSISASISDFYPQNTLWRLCIGVDSFPRYLIAFIYYNKYYRVKIENKTYKSFYKMILKIGFLFHFIELTSLLILTYISSIEIFVVHMLSFVLFLISSTIYMLITLATHYWPNDSNNISSNINEFRENRSKNFKLKILIFYLSSFMLSLYFYIRHNRYCEPYVYSFFSLCEYLTVLANIAYHAVIFYDLNLFGIQYKIQYKIK